MAAVAMVPGEWYDPEKVVRALAHNSGVQIGDNKLVSPPSPRAPFTPAVYEWVEDKGIVAQFRALLDGLIRFGFVVVEDGKVRLLSESERDAIRETQPGLRDRTVRVQVIDEYGVSRWLDRNDPATAEAMRRAQEARGVDYSPKVRECSEGHQSPSYAYTDTGEMICRHCRAGAPSFDRSAAERGPIL